MNAIVAAVLGNGQSRTPLRRMICIVSTAPLFNFSSVSVFYLSIYRSGTVNSKSFVGKVFLRIKRKFELTYAL